MELAVFMAESGLIEKKGQCYPYVLLIGRDKNRKRIKYRVQIFPYFYLTEQDYMKLKDEEVFKNFHVQKVEGSIARNLMKRVMTKISVTDAGRISDTIKVINKLNKQKVIKEEGIWTYEADLSRAELLALRYLIDKGIKSGVDITDTVIKPVELIVPLRKWLIDFESYVDKTYSLKPNPKYPIIMVTIYDSYDDKLYTYYTFSTTWKEKLPFGETIKYGLKHEVKEFKTESQLLDALVELVIEKDPDLIAAWNLNRYDIEVWKMRMDVNRAKCLYKFSDISPMKSILWQNRPHRVKGRILFDMMVAFKQFTDAELRSYNLGLVAEEEKLNFEKVNFIGTAANTWDNHPDVMFKRNVIDVLIMKSLDEKYQLIDMYDDCRTEFGCLFHETFIPNRVIDTALMRLVNNKVILRTSSYGKYEEEKLLGAVVKEPKVGEYSNLVGFDFGREYPNIIKSLNISPETYREDTKEPCYTIEYKGMVFKFSKSPIGLLPQLITYFFKKRTEYDIEHKKAIDNKEDESVIKRWERRSYNMKKKTNAIYGVMKYPKFRLHRKECTQAVAVVGRISIEELIVYATTVLGYEVVYADTDSLFIKLHTFTNDEQLEEAKKLQSLLNEHISQFFKDKYGVKAPAELGLKKLYEKMIFIAKKNYCGKSKYDEKKGWKIEYEYKGIASVRSDSSDLEKSSLESILRMKLDSLSKHMIEAFKNKVLTDFQDRRFNCFEVSYPAQIKKRIYQNKTGEWVTDYKKTIPAHIKSAVYSNIYLDTDYASGDKPRRLPVKFPKSTSKGQQTLFEGITYPTEWEFMGKKRKVTDISIVDGMSIPTFFLKHIDWERIGKRLNNKLDTILCIGCKKNES